MLKLLPFLLVLAVWIYAFVDCLNTPEKEVRKLPKTAWVFIVLLFGQVLVGPIAWFAVGRPRRNTPYGATRVEERRWVAPDDNPDFLKSLGDDSAARSERDTPKDGSDDPAGPASDGTPASPSEPPAKPSSSSASSDAPGDPLEEWEEEFRRKDGPDDAPPKS